jgi:hypothetical protein
LTDDRRSGPDVINAAYTLYCARRGMIEYLTLMQSNSSDEKSIILVSMLSVIALGLYLLAQHQQVREQRRELSLLIQEADKAYVRIPNSFLP